MPRHYRQCHLCKNSTTTNPDLVFFRANEQILRALKINTQDELYMCEEHFDESDVKIAGNSKRLRQGCEPVKFTTRDVSLLDHGYVNTSLLVANTQLIDHYHL